MPKIHVLVVDDNDDARDILQIILTECGYRVAQACDGYAAIEAVEERKPDVVIMDIFMPRLDGLGATQRIKAPEKYSAIPIIAQTAQPTSLVGEEHLFFEICVKPCEPDVLIKCIERATATERA